LGLQEIRHHMVVVVVVVELVEGRQFRLKPSRYHD
jgi:hypothetical protein